ncbi:methylglyoxal reductase (NADPH-dependent) gre2 [Tulasnella sp. JGI-2019a]|nr:methylglyoxal reductase (NADPH-dependent) gre2 [Tulasnella sp. JGI-2019a]
MAPVLAPAKVLVTGASGFIAVWVCQTLLDQGYHVVGTGTYCLRVIDIVVSDGLLDIDVINDSAVRSKSKGEYMQKLFEKAGHGEDRFSFVIVEDIEKPGAFDEAVVGVDAVEHTASPFHFNADDPNELIGPAVSGTVGVLESIKKHAPGVKRVVITSSVASVIHDKGESQTFDETDWNVTSPKIVEEKGKDTPSVHKYRASKVLAERAAWKFLEENKDSVAFDLVTICPPMIWGPILQEVKSADALNTSIAGFYAHTKPGKTEQELLAPSGNFSDVRDVALIHALALSNQNAGGERFIVSSGPFTYQDALDAIHKADPSLTDVPKGTPGKGKSVKGIVYLSAKAEATFGIKFKDIDEVAPATFRALMERGF